MVLDIRRLMEVVRKSARQFGNFWMWLWIVPADSLLAAEDCITVVQELPI